MDKYSQISFSGFIKKNCGRFSQDMVVPGKNDIECPVDWPIELCPGTLNVALINPLPKGFDTEKGVKILDNKGYPPEFTIPYEMIKGNTLRPESNCPERGTAQVWRAKLLLNGIEEDVWILRRIGSRIKKQFEFVSGEYLKSKLGLENGMRVNILLYYRTESRES